MYLGKGGPGRPVMNNLEKEYSNIIQKERAQRAQPQRAQPQRAQPQRAQPQRVAALAGGKKVNVKKWLLLS